MKPVIGERFQIRSGNGVVEDRTVAERSRATVEISIETSSSCERERVKLVSDTEQNKTRGKLQPR